LNPRGGAEIAEWSDPKTLKRVFTSQTPRLRVLPRNPSVQAKTISGHMNGANGHYQLEAGNPARLATGEGA